MRVPQYQIKRISVQGKAGSLANDRIKSDTEAYRLVLSIPAIPGGLYFHVI